MNISIKPFLNKLAILISLSCFSPLVTADNDVNQSLDVKVGGAVKISIVRGDLRVRGWDKAQVKVSGELDSATDEFIFKTDGDETIIKVELDDGFFGKNWSSDESDLTVFMPSQNYLEMGGVSIDVAVDDILNDLDISVVSGDVEVNNTKGGLDVNSVSGDIDIRNHIGGTKLNSVSGSIDVDVQADHFDAQTVSGDIEGSIGKSDVVELSSVSGDINLKLQLADDGRIDSETVSGDISLRFSNSPVNARFEISTGPGGDIRNSITNDRPDSTFIGSEEVRFKSGNGNGSVDISTMSGTIEVE